MQQLTAISMKVMPTYALLIDLALIFSASIAIDYFPGFPVFLESGAIQLIFIPIFSSLCLATLKENVVLYFHELQDGNDKIVTCRQPVVHAPITCVDWRKIFGL